MVVHKSNMKKIDIRVTLHKNRQVNKQQLYETINVIQELREKGITGNDYNIIPPFATQKSSQSKSSKRDTGDTSSIYSSF